MQHQQQMAGYAQHDASLVSSVTGLPVPLTEQGDALSLSGYLADDFLGGTVHTHS